MDHTHMDRTNMDRTNTVIMALPAIQEFVVPAMVRET
jgi:hypothetical protein